MALSPIVIIRRFTDENVFITKESCFPFAVQYCFFLVGYVEERLWWPIQAIKVLYIKTFSLIMAATRCFVLCWAGRKGYQCDEIAFRHFDAISRLFTTNIRPTLLRLGINDLRVYSIYRFLHQAN